MIQIYMSDLLFKQQSGKSVAQWWGTVRNLYNFLKEQNSTVAIHDVIQRKLIKGI